MRRECARSYIYGAADRQARLFHHGFCFPERAVYDTLAAEETWSKIFAMWDRRVK